ncbi:hypothetical protein [Herbaspirillum frisingense]|uniref:hypothetical protein n=1 Tax=Herbaspirillum frisingense TaxID=92645 RepID=UPI001F318472|nr:hypothetical protein [Herbaspirillum frisingense]UIN23499.1 hypothetical protein LAZ82_10555 [Herbaspirillum frisingense]
MLKWLIHWYNGEAKFREFDQDDFPGVVIYPGFYIEYHWTAKIARLFAAFYLKHWQWLWGTAIGIASLWVAVLSLK